MTQYRRSTTEGGTFFFTLVTHRRARWLCEKRAQNVLRESIKIVRDKYPFTIEAWVLLPDHMHAIWTLPIGDSDYSTRWRLIKTRVTKALGSQLKQNSSRKKKGEGGLWQRRFWEHTIRDERDFKNHMDYTHYNPVKHGLVERPRDWSWSTFHKYVAGGVYPLDWAGGWGFDEMELD
jgi:putative transposase